MTKPDSDPTAPGASPGRSPFRVHRPTDARTETAASRRSHPKGLSPQASDSQPGDHEELLRAAGVRITRQRRTILAILPEPGGDHPDAVEIFRRASAIDATISLSTVYRTMKLLEEKGAIQRHVFEGGPARFEGADGVHHDHLIDLDTGVVVEFRSERIERLQEEIARELGYEIVSHRLELYGRKRPDG